MGKQNRKSGPKDKFAALPEDFKDAMAAAQGSELTEQLAGILKAELQNQAAKKADGDVKSAREALGIATKVYTEATKYNSLKAGFITRVLADRGDPTSVETIRLGVAAL